MIGLNNLVIEAYSGTTQIQDPGGMLARAENLQFTKGYGGGICLNASFYVERNVLDWWLINGVNRIVFRNGQKAVFEGWIANKQDLIGAGAQGTTVRLQGGFGQVLMNWLVNKPWADTRVDDETWRYQETADEVNEEMSISRGTGKIHIYPKDTAFTTGEYAAVRYSAPTGQTVKRITFDYGLDEATGAWEISAWRSTDASSWTQMTNASGETYAAGTTTVITATGTGSIDVTLATPSQYIELRYYARGTNNPVAHDHNHGEWSSIVVYTETGSINMEEIAKDIVGIVTDLNSSTAFVDAAGTALSLVPFVTSGFQSAAEVLEDAVGRGDGVYNRWAFGCLMSEQAATPNGEPVLYCEQVPALTDYDYAIRLTENNLQPPITISEDIDAVRNWIALAFTGKLGYPEFRSPDDNASLTDATSTTAYGRKAMSVNLGDCVTAIADAFGQRLLAQYKDPQYRLVTPITVLSYIRSKDGDLIPACEIEPGKRVMIEDYLDGLTFLITGTAYDDESETCAITTGRLDEAILPRFRHEPVSGGPVNPAEAGGGADGGAGGMQRHIWELIGWSRKQFLDAKAAGTWKKVKKAAQRAKLETGSYKNYRKYL